MRPCFPSRGRPAAAGLPVIALLAAVAWLCPNAAHGQALPGANPAGEAEPTLVLTPGEREWLQAHPVIRVGATPDWPPFEFVDDAGLYQGICADILRRIGEMAGFQIEAVPGPWPELHRKLQTKALDVSPSMQASAARAEHVLFTQPFLNFPHAIYTHRKGTAIPTLADLAGKRVAVEQGYYEHEYFIAHHPEFELVPVENALQALMLVANGGADAYVGNVAVASYLIDKNVLTDIRMGHYAEMGRLQLSMGVRQDYGPLVSILNKGLAALTAEDLRATVSRYTVVPQTIALTNREMAWIEEHPVIRLGIDPEFAPFEFIGKDGAYQGIASDYIQLLNERLGLNMEVVHTASWQGAVDALRAGDLDVLPCVGRNEERAAYLAFSEPYLSFHRVVITRLDTPFVGGLDELAGWRIGVQRDSSHDAFVHEYATVPPVLFDTFEDTLLAVARGEIDCAIGNAATTAYWIKKLGLTNLKLAVPVGRGVETLHFGVRNDWPELVALLNKGLASVTEAEMIAIRRKWMDVDVTPGIDYRWVWTVLALACAVLLPPTGVALIHNRRLRREIAYRREVEGALKDSEESYRTLVENAKSIILRLSPGGTITYVNTFGEQFLGYDAAELVGQPLVGTIVPESDSKGRDLRELAADIAESPEQFLVHENENRTKDGRRVIVAWTNCPLYNNAGELEEILCVGNDVTTARTAAETLRRYDFIVNTVNEMMSVINAEGHYEAVNDEWCAATGVTREAALGHPIAAVWSEPIAMEHILPRLRRCLNGETVQYEAEFDLPDRGRRQFEITMYPYSNQTHRTTHAIVVAQDITERKEAEVALREAKQAAEAGNRAKSAFLANMSHEIRTPLNAVLGYTQLLQRFGGLSPDQAHALDAIRRSGDHLLSLINDILELSRIEAGHVELHPVTFSVERLLGDLELMFHERAEAKGLLLHLDVDRSIPEFVVADRNRVNQVLINLVGNALKFTERGGIALRARVERDPDHIPGNGSGAFTLAFEVEDTGCGIPPALQTQVFETFEQAGESSTRQGGTGLGLAICRRFARLMGGDVDVTSEPGKGSCFRFTLRAGAGVAEDVTPASVPSRIRRLSPDQPEQRVLVVDDRDTNRDLLCRILGFLGFKTREAANGVEAIEQFKAWAPQIVLIDLVMPVLDGREAIRRIRALPNGGHAAIIALTASTLDDDRDAVLADGANAFLRKPFRDTELLEEIGRHAHVVFVTDDNGAVTERAVLSVAEARQAIRELPGELASNLESIITRGAIGEAKAIAVNVRRYSPGLAELILQRAGDYRLNELQAIWSESTPL